MTKNRCLADIYKIDLVYWQWLKNSRLDHAELIIKKCKPCLNFSVERLRDFTVAQNHQTLVKINASIIRLRSIQGSIEKVTKLLDFW